MDPGPSALVMSVLTTQPRCLSGANTASINDLVTIVVSSIEHGQSPCCMLIREIRGNIIPLALNPRFYTLVIEVPT